MTTPTESTPTALRSLLDDAAAHAAEFLEELPERRVAPTATADELRKELGGPLDVGPGDPRRVLADLAKTVEPGLMATPGGRFFGFVIGGGLPAALAADWLTSAWDQNACLYVAAPAASVVEEVCGLSATPPARPAPGFMSTERLGCGLLPARARGISSRG